MNEGPGLTQLSPSRWRLRTNDGSEIMGVIDRRDGEYFATSANGTADAPVVSGPHSTLQKAADALDDLW